MDHLNCTGDQHANPITQKARRQAEYFGDLAGRYIDSGIPNCVTVLRSRLNTSLLEEALYLINPLHRVTTDARISQDRINQSGDVQFTDTIIRKL